MVGERPFPFQPIIRYLIGISPPALAVGYACFYSIFPSETFPVTSDASAGWILFVLLVAAIIGGMVGEDLREALLSAFVAVPVGFLLAIAMAYTPAFAGLYLLEPSAVPFFMAHYSVFVLALAFPLDLVGAILGQVVRARLQFEPAAARVGP
jgi:hypothetical protein